MFIGHYAPALAAATLPRAPRLGPLFIAAQLIDIALYLLALAGVEHYGIQPWFTTMSPLDLYDVRWTHSLLCALGWAAGFALAVRLAGGINRTAWIGAGVVVGAWFLDLLTHTPDLTLAGGAQRFGFGLWNHPYIAMPLELGITAAALTLYANRTHARDWRGKVALILLTAALLGFQLAAWLGPRPHEAIDPAPAATSLSALAAYTILTVFAWWVASTRAPA
ncbi:hypothetical protein [Sphingomonas bacterium]|uniref:hypothetical protein n=1 Tax=Sphingomonas bacterium TaxID=1895847 RepID=UPI00157769A1|nr:hypothetical protein [Sphingomonas bacterium]